LCIHWGVRDNCLFVAGNESCPQPQTSEHLAAIEIMKLKHIIIMQNKIDLVKESQAKEQHDQIVKFVQGLSHLNRVVRVATNLENLEYSGISLNVENSGNSRGILCNLREKL